MLDVPLKDWYHLTEGSGATLSRSRRPPRRAGGLRLDDTARHRTADTGEDLANTISTCLCVLQLCRTHMTEHVHDATALLVPSPSTSTQQPKLSS